jgi:hypothetical protein
VLIALEDLFDEYLAYRSSMEEQSRLWRQIAKSEAQRDEVPQKPQAD